MSQHPSPSFSPEQYVDHLVSVFTAKGDPIRAEQQRAYMRHKFEYCGLGAPQWLGMLKDIFAQHGTFTGNDLKSFVALCFEQEYREVHYAGLEMMQKRLKEQNKSWIRVLEKSVQTHAWWDTVDWLAKLTGIHFRRYPELQHPYAYKWIHSPDMWLQRVAIIHQLLWKEQTDEALLFDLIKIQATNKEFFIQKACGWALRQHAKTFPKRVEWFLRHHTLSNLTIREARRQLDKS
jgi:3-methyladenine DNA glycosylase AlkD